jgi:lysophospholipase L1-like esterase
VGVALAEAGARLLLEPPEAVRIYRIAGVADSAGKSPGETTELLLEHSNNRAYVQTEAGRRLRPNIVAVIQENYLSKQEVTIRTNSLGHRHVELGDKTRPRVLFLGDSITCAGFLNDEDTFVRRVEALATDAGEPLETINTGVGSIGLEDEFAILMETGIDTQPDVVVLGFYLNDVQNSPGVEIRRVPPWLGWSRLAQHVVRLLPAAETWEDTAVDSETLSAWQEQARSAFPPGDGDPKRDPLAFNRMIHQSFSDWGSAWSEGAWDRMAPVFRELKRQSQLHGFELVFVMFPVRQQVQADFLYDYPQRQLADLARELEVPMLDLLPPLREADAQSNEPLFYDHCHHTPQGQHVIANSIHAFLRDRAAIQVAK